MKIFYAKVIKDEVLSAKLNKILENAKDSEKITVYKLAMGSGDDGIQY